MSMVAASVVGPSKISSGRESSGCVRKRKSEPPIWTRSPCAKARSPTGTPFTKVPFSVARSRSRNPSESAENDAVLPRHRFIPERQGIRRLPADPEFPVSEFKHGAFNRSVQCHQTRVAQEESTPGGWIGPPLPCDIIAKIDGQRARIVPQDTDEPVGKMETNFSDLSTRRAERVRAGLPHTFAPNEVVANRFRIIRFIARGGMGEVYEADDPEVGERVALKTIRPEIASDKQMIDRFRREIQLARSVTHPNVCRIFDLFHHRNSATGETVTFLTMELLDGETLAARIARSGRIAPLDALPFVNDWRLGSTPRRRFGYRSSGFQEWKRHPGAAAGGRRARARRGDGFRSGATNLAGRSSRIGSGRGDAGIHGAGTGQRRCGYGGCRRICPRCGHVRDADGIAPVRRDFAQRGPTQSAGPPDAAASARPRPARKWNTTITWCLERDPRKRPGSASEVIRALRGDAPIFRRRAAMALALAVLVAAGAAFALRPRVLPSPPTYPGAVAAGGFHGRRSVAVLGFQNLAGRTDSMWLSAALTEMLTAELGVGEQLRMIPERTSAA